jgi:aldose sugar dehydrogenase
MVMILLKRVPLGNRLYRYELVNNKLINPKLLLDLPARGSVHNSGKMIIGPNNDIYLVIGDVSANQSQIKNFLNGSAPDGRGGILRITHNGKAIKKGDDANILGKKNPLNLYYAYGILNSFRIDFDPVTKKLWDTENGPRFGDEINLVNPGFNSGWDGYRVYGK